jgi:hypothetical protein
VNLESEPKLLSKLGGFYISTLAVSARIGARILFARAISKILDRRNVEHIYIYIYNIFTCIYIYIYIMYTIYDIYIYIYICCSYSLSRTYLNLAGVARI